MGSGASTCKCCQSATPDAKIVVKRERPTIAHPQPAAFTPSDPLVNKHRANRLSPQASPQPTTPSTPSFKGHSHRDSEKVLAGTGASEQLHTGADLIDDHAYSTPTLEPTRANRSSGRRSSCVDTTEGLAPDNHKLPTSSISSGFIRGLVKDSANNNGVASFGSRTSLESRSLEFPLKKEEVHHDAPYSLAPRTHSSMKRSNSSLENYLSPPTSSEQPPKATVVVSSTSSSSSSERFMSMARARVTIDIDVATLGEGCYLQYATTNQGTLTAVWSKSYPSTSSDKGSLIAFLKPIKAVPAFKYKGSSRRQDLVKGITTNKSDYYRGWLAFIKIARSNEADIMFLDGINDVPPVRIYAMDSGNRLRLLRYNQWESVQDSRAVAVIPGNSDLFAGINSLDSTLLIQKANECGGAASSL